MENLKDKKVLVTGGNSLIGKEIVRVLQNKGANVYAAYHCDFDLLNEKETNDLFNQVKPEYVFANAGFNGGLQFNLEAPSLIFEKTTKINLNTLLSCKIHNVKKVVNILTSCSYPNTTEPLQEYTFLLNPPSDSVSCHAYAKRNQFLYGRYLCKQYGVKVVNVVFNNCYGIGARYSQPERLKVADALIKKFCDAAKAKAEFVEVWGTGNVRRELLYCKDAGEAAVVAMELYEDTELPINMGWGEDISIKDLAFLIRNLSGFNGEIKFLTDKPEGQLRKILNINRMKSILKWQPVWNLEAGLTETISWYKKTFYEPYN